MSPLRILHIIPSLDQSGAEKQLALLAMHLPKDRFDVHVCALTRSGPYEEVLRAAGVPVHVIGKRLKWDPTSLYRIYRLIKDLKPQIVQTWIFAANCYGRVAARWAKVPHIFASERCVDRWKSGYHFAIDSLLERVTEKFVVNADAIRHFYVRHGIPNEKIVTIQNAFVATDPSVENSRDLLAELGATKEERIVGFVGRLWPQKRVQDLIWAADILRLSGWNVRVLIVGDGPRRASLQRFAEALDITDRVHFLGHRSDVPQLLKRMEVLVLPSTYEGLPNVLLEAMAASKPVVACRIPGVDEVVVDGQTGILVPPQQPLELARGIRKLLEDSELAQRMGESGRDRVQQQFSLDRMLVQYARLYEATAGASVGTD